MENLSEQIAKFSPEKRALLEKLLQRKQAEKAAPPTAIAAVARGAAHYPLSSAEQRLWFLDRFSDTQAAFNLHAALELSGALDLDVLQRSLERLLQRHEVLRTRYVKLDGEPRRVIDAAGAFQLVRVDLRTQGDAAQREREVQRLAREHANQRFQLDRGGLFAATVIVLDDQRQVLLLAIHHIISDAWSLALMLDEIREGYAALHLDANAAIPAAPLQYLDYAVWQQRELASPRMATQVDYWRRQLQAAPDLLELPTDRPRPPNQSYAGDELRFSVPRELLDRLKHVARQQQCTLFMLGLSAFVAVLARFSGRNDIVVGTDVANRNHAGSENLIGFLVNQLALRCRFEATDTLAQLVQSVRRTCLDAYANQDAPFNHLVDQLGVSRDPSRTPLFQVKFMLQNTPDAKPRQAGLSMRTIDFAEELSQFDLLLALKETPDSAFGSLRYRTDLFDRATAQRLVQHTLAALEVLAREPERRLDRMDWLFEDERALVSRVNATAADYAFANLPDAIAAAALADPHKIAVSCAGKELDYAGLIARSDRLAAHLLGLGLGAEQPVAVCMGRGIDLLVALLAVLRIGACYVPLDPDYGAERLNYVLEDCAARLILCDDSSAGALATSIEKLIVADALDTGGSAAAPPCGWPAVAPQQLAYIIYTSGSTGRPKGVAVTHLGLSNFLRSLRELTGMDRADRLLAVTTVAFDIAALELYLPLYCGAWIGIATRDEVQDSRRLLARLRADSITCMQATPSTWRGLVLAAGGTPLSLKVLCGGEALPQDLALQLLDAGTQLVNVYGPTETTIWSAFGAVDRSHLDNESSVALGQPIANTRLHVLDRHGNEQPIGVPGELYIGGDGLARGYRGKPALTALAFVPDPFSIRAGARLYRTGDLVKRLADGRLAYLGREDHQVKIRGHRIELGEIENVLGSHAEVAQAVVVTRADTIGSASLVAFIQCEDRAADIDDLMRHAASYLPRYMLPNDVRIVAAMPLTPNGKIDRKALAHAALEQIDSGDVAGTAPGSALEIQVAALWQRLLGTEQTFLEQDFFRSGGHSLLAVQLLDRVEKECGIVVPLQQFFRNPSVAGIVQALQAQDAQRSDYPIIQPDLGARDLAFPLTSIQQAYWLGRSGSFELGNIATQNYLEIEIVDLHVERFAAAWNRLVQRHDMLRAVFLADGTQRFVTDVDDYVPAYHDLRALAPEAAETFLLDLRARMQGAVLPAASGPLFDLRISRRDERRYRVHFCIDMLISDVISNHILFGELDLLYRQPDTVLPALELSFRDYVLAEQALHDSPRFQAARQYWLDRIDTFPGRPELPLACDPSRLGEQVFSRRRFQIAAPLWQAMKQRAETLRVSPTVLVLSAFGEVLANWSHGARFALNLTLFNRLPLHAQVDNLVGDFTSSLLLEMDYSAALPFGARASAVQQRLWQDLDHKLFSGVDMIRELSRARGGTQGAAMPVVFTSILGVSTAGSQAKPDAGSRTQAEEGYSASQTSQVWLDHQVAEQDGALTLVWDALDAVFPSGMLDAMFAAYSQRLTCLGRDALAWDQVVSLMPPDQLARRAAINHVPAPIGDERLHDLFAQQAAATPAAIAIRCTGIDIDYATLRTWSMALAAQLAAQGVGRGELVAIVMHKGWEQVVAALAILQCGAAYMPVDADLPDQRRRQVLHEGGARVALIQTALRDTVADDGVELIAFDAASLAATPAHDAIDAATGPDDIAYVIFTSGSTGKPKGVVIDHRGAVNTVLDINRRFGVGANDAVLAMSSLSFDLSVYDLFGLLAAGGTIVVPRAQEMDNAASWFDYVCQAPVTIWNTVPALMQLLVDHCETLSPPSLASLRVVMMSGDWIPVGLPDRIRRLAPHATIVSLGGATEASIWSIFHPITAPSAGLRSIPYGKPLSNQHFQVLDSRMQPRPDWVTGALYIGGIGLAKGYWNDPEKTAASFVRAPDGELLYRTGDLGRYMDDGNIEFLGREDSQVKVQGYRIELGDIEAALQSHPAIAAAAVSAVGENQQSKSLVAYIVPRGNAADTADTGVAITDHHQRNLFKLERRGVRRFQAHFTRIAIAALRSDLRHCFEGLACTPIDAHALPKYRYPSASSLYPVQLYLHVDVAAAEIWQIAAGFYYYSPAEAALVRLGDDNPIEPGRDCHAPRLYWVADIDAIGPLYPAAQAHRFCALEAGYAHAIVMAGAAAVGMALDTAWHDVAYRDRPLLPAHALWLGTVDLGQGACAAEVATAAPNLSAGFIALPPREESTAPAYNALQRQSHRRYAQRACTMAQLSRLLGMLDRTAPLEYWLYAKPGRCDGLDTGGWYRYRPHRHALEPHYSPLDPAELYNADNAVIYSNAAFALFLSAPLHDGEAPAAVLAACGATGQGLMGDCWQHDIGLCPIGFVRNDLLREALGRDERWQFLHGFVGGPIDAESSQRWEPEVGAVAQAPNFDALAAYLAARLPAYMVPRVYIPLAALPLSSNGKVDRKALPKPDTHPAAPSAAVAPENERETILVALWSRLLKLERVGTRDNFFSLGGNSLIAMQLASRLRIEHAVDISLRQIFEQPTIAELAATITLAPQQAAPESVIDIHHLRGAWHAEQRATLAAYLRALPDADLIALRVRCGLNEESPWTP